MCIRDSSNLIIQILAALATGGAVVVSQYLGRQERRHARNAAKQLVYTATALSILLLAVALVFRKGLLRFIFGAIDPEVMRHAQTYFLISAFSYPFLAVYNSIAALFRSMGNSKISMLTSVLMNVVNIGGNAILIYVFHWGVAGAATATLASRILSSAVMLVLIRNPHFPIFLTHLLRVRFRWDIIKRILCLSLIHI